MNIDVRKQRSRKSQARSTFAWLRSPFVGGTLMQLRADLQLHVVVDVKDTNLTSGTVLFKSGESLQYDSCRTVNGQLIRYFRYIDGIYAAVDDKSLARFFTYPDAWQREFETIGTV